MDTHALWQLFLHMLDVSTPALAFLAGLFVGMRAERRHYPKAGNEMHDQYDVIELTTAKPEIEAEREPFFSVDGKLFTIPKEVPPHIAMVYLKTLRTSSSDRATSKVMDMLIGEEGVNALAKCETITKEQMKQILDRVQKKVEGVMEDIAGN